MIVNHAILHVFDFEGGATQYSARELDLSERPVKSYVQRTLRKLVANAESRHGEFSPESAFAGELARYLEGGSGPSASQGFVALSTAIAEFLYGELRKCADAAPCDLLVADFEADPEKRTASQVPDGADDLDPEASAVQEALAAQAAEADYAGRGARCFAIALLPRKQAFVHLVDSADGYPANGIARHDDTLPTPASRLDTYAVVFADTLAIDFCDKPRSIAGTETLLIPEGLLQCTSGASSKEVIEQVTRIVEDVAEEYGANTARAVSRAKAVMQEKAAESEYLPPWDIAREVFEDEPRMRERFEETARDEELPERVAVKRSLASRMAKSHRIRTDTGIEITFPSEYSTNPDFIEFVTEADGTMVIELKNIGSIENR